LPRRGVISFDRCDYSFEPVQFSSQVF
jgi:hypothetical protein